MSRIAVDAEALCSGFGSSQFRVAGAGWGRGLLEEMDSEIEPYGTPGQTALQRNTLFRVPTATATRLALRRGINIDVRHELTGDLLSYRISDARREGDGAITILYLASAS